MEERGGTVEQCWKNNGTVSEEQCGGTVEHWKWNSEKVMVEQ